MTGSSQPRTRGVELVDVPLDVARGFVNLLVPILLHTAPVGINIYARRARRSLSTIGFVLNDAAMDFALARMLT